MTSNPLTNLSTKRPKDSSRIQYKNNKKYIEDINNLQSQDLLDFYNLLLEKVKSSILPYLGCNLTLLYM